MQSERVTKITDELAVALRAMQEIARRIAKISKEAKLLVDEDRHMQSFKVEFMEAVVQ